MFKKILLAVFSLSRQFLGNNTTTAINNSQCDFSINFGRSRLTFFVKMSGSATISFSARSIAC